jgi:hypothetical protein
MSDYQFFILLVCVGGAVWWLTRVIREAAWTATPEAAKQRQEAAQHARFVEQLKQERRKARRDKWAARLSWMNTAAAALPDWMFGGLVLRLSIFILVVGFLYAVQARWLG